MRELIFATGNRHKLQEIQAILGDDFILKTPADYGITEEIPETSDTLEGNAQLKTDYIYSRTGSSCFADDTGLEVEALDNAPGVYSARYAGESCNSEQNIDKLLENLKGNANRKARFRTVICLILDGQKYLFEGVVQGSILEARQGSGGFGYDAVFMPDGFSNSFAEMSLEQKNEISHRGRAVAALVEFLKS